MIAFLVIIPLDLVRPYFWLKWNVVRMPWPRVALSALFTIFWIGAVASSVYTCGDLCSAAGSIYAGGWIKYASLCCDCSDLGPTGCFGSGDDDVTHLEPRVYRYEVTQALDAVLM